ncbi:MAG: RNA 2',3'-cyclic phosphodiesterase [Anaerolineales bacterium]
MAQSQTIRTFIALPLSEEITRQLGEIQSVLSRRCPHRSVRWVEPERIHLTLFFLGDIVLALRPQVEEALGVVARNVAPFTFEAAGLGAFPRMSRPRVLWVGIEDPTRRLALLHQAVNDAMEAVGFERETRPFSPHLTLGRVRRGASRRDVQQVGEIVQETEVGRLGEAPVSEMIFFRSILKSTGAEYIILKTFALGG